MESLIDELAHASGKDPVEYRRLLLKDHPRHLGVLNAAAEKSGWGGALPPGRARGVAVHESFGSFVAQVAEVSVENGRIRVHRVVCAIDCGTAVNPEAVAAQMESGIVFGLSAALNIAPRASPPLRPSSRCCNTRDVRTATSPAMRRSNSMPASRIR